MTQRAPTKTDTFAVHLASTVLFEAHHQCPIQGNKQTNGHHIKLWQVHNRLSKVFHVARQLNEDQRFLIHNNCQEVDLHKALDYLSFQIDIIEKTFALLAQKWPKAFKEIDERGYMPLGITLDRIKETLVRETHGKTPVKTPKAHHEVPVPTLFGAHKARRRLFADDSGHIEQTTKALELQQSEIEKQPTILAKEEVESIEQDFANMLAADMAAFGLSTSSNPLFR